MWKDSGGRHDKETENVFDERQVVDCFKCELYGIAECEEVFCDDAAPDKPESLGRTENSDEEIGGLQRVQNCLVKSTNYELCNG